MTIQREVKEMDALQAENAELRKALATVVSALEIILTNTSDGGAANHARRTLDWIARGKSVERKSNV